jgi:hypothetical protein
MMPPRRLADNEAESAERATGAGSVSSIGSRNSAIARQSWFQEDNHNAEHFALRRAYLPYFLRLASGRTIKEDIGDV